MIHKNIKLSDTGQFNSIFLDYLNNKKPLRPFFNLPPAEESFGKQINQRKFPRERRNVLTSVLSEQYKNIKNSDAVEKNIRALQDEKTFTVTTGHQLNIFTGPLYFIYKIISTINLAEQLNDKYPDYHFVPVYWMASEDHDFEEINHFNLFGKQYSWNTDQKGPVGRFNINGLTSLLEELPESVPIFEQAYKENTNLTGAVRQYVHQLFGKYGLVVVDADNHQQKNLFVEVIKDDLLNHRANDLAGTAAEQLSKAGYKSQVYPRTINFFYMEDGLRERIIKDGDTFNINNTDINFSTNEILELAEQSPEKFSPNVVLRPLYQEMILPNLAYIGGPAEIAYWLQVKSIFDKYETTFPILLPRNFATVINKGVYNKVEKLGIEPEKLFMPLHELKSWYLTRYSDNEIDLSKEIEGINKYYECIKRKTAEIDKSLEGFVGAEASKSLKGLENISKRLRKAEEKNQDTAIKQLEKIIDKLFPDNNLQERHDNLLNFYINNPNFIDDIKQHLNPLKFCFNIICYNG